jgi:hypothetical protein
MIDACYDPIMRTTLDLEEDVLEVTKQLARQQGKTAGQMASLLIRRALQPGTAPKSRNGVLLFQPKEGAKQPNLKLVNELRDSESATD